MALTQKFQEALNYCFELHREQKRKGSGVPHVAHLLGTASLVLEAGGSEDEATAALLHDAAEDQGGQATLAEIEAKFGSKVRMIVLECSDSLVQPKLPWRQRKESYIAAIPEKSPEALLVSLADKLYNARAIVDDYAVHQEELWSRFSADREEITWYYQQLAHAFANQRSKLKHRGFCTLHDRFADLVQQMKQR